jgi:hypothetical protein
MSAQADVVTRLVLASAETRNSDLRHRMVGTAARMVRANQGFSAVDAGQLGLDAAGLIPGYGEIFDGINALVSLIRGDYMGAALSLISMVPAAGDAIGKGGKVALWISKLAKKKGPLGKAGKAFLKYGPKMKAALAKFSKFVVENRRQILIALRTISNLVRTVADPSQAEEDSSGLGSAAKMMAKSKKIKAISEKAEPHLHKMNGAVLSLIQLAQASDDMFQKLQERAEQESAGAY